MAEDPGLPFIDVQFVLGDLPLLHGLPVRIVVQAMVVQVVEMQLEGIPARSRGLLAMTPTLARPPVRLRTGRQASRLGRRAAWVSVGLAVG